MSKKQGHNVTIGQQIKWDCERNKANAKNKIKMLQCMDSSKLQDYDVNTIEHLML